MEKQRSDQSDFLVERQSNHFRTAVEMKSAGRRSPWRRARSGGGRVLDCDLVATIEGQEARKGRAPEGRKLEEAKNSLEVIAGVEVGKGDAHTGISVGPVLKRSPASYLYEIIKLIYCQGRVLMDAALC